VPTYKILVFVENYWMLIVVLEWYGKDGSYGVVKILWLVDFGISNSLSICFVDKRGLIAIIPNTANTVGLSLSTLIWCLCRFWRWRCRWCNTSLEIIQWFVYEEIDYSIIPLLADNYVVPLERARDWDW